MTDVERVESPWVTVQFDEWLVLQWGWRNKEHGRDDNLRTWKRAERRERERS